MNITKPSNKWRIGSLFSKTGTTAIIEISQQNGMLLAIHEINNNGGINGRQIEVTSYDPGSNVKKYGELAETLIVKDKINIIFGCYMSSCRKEVLPVVERYNALLFYPTLYEGFEFSPNVLYGGATPNQNSVPLANFLLTGYGKKIYFVGSDYIYPRESNRMMRHAITQGGGEILNEVYVPVRAGEASFTHIIEDIKRVKPDAIFSTVVGKGAINFYRAYKKMGGDVSSCPIASLTTNEAEITEMGTSVAAGHITSAPYFRNLQTERNQLFKESYRSLFGNITGITSCCEAAYVQMHMFATALEVVGEIDPIKIREQLLGAHFDAPQGSVKIDPDNGHTYLHALIAVVDDNGEFVIETRVKRSIKPDPYLVHPEVNDLNLRLQTARYVK